jgi:hypothetical protein
MPMNPRLLRPLARSGDSDVRAYIAAVEQADTQPLEQGIKDAYRDFIVGCKADGIWDAIKASCILAGARTLTGALTPLKGAAPTNVNFVSGDYVRKTGLVGGTGKYIDTNRLRTAEGQNDSHFSVFSSAAGSGGFQRAIGSGAASSTGTSVMLRGTSGTGEVGIGHGNSNITYANVSDINNFLGASRSSSASFNYRMNGSAATVNDTSQARPAGNWYVFNTNPTSTAVNARFAFYSIGTAVDLSLLDTRVSALYTAIGAAI